ATATTSTYTLSLHDALPIFVALQDPTGFIQILRNHRGADDRHVAFGKQDRQRTRGVERKKLLAPGPRFFLYQSQFLAILAEGEANEPAGGEHGMMEKRQHDTATEKLWRIAGRIEDRKS